MALLNLHVERSLSQPRSFCTFLFHFLLSDCSGSEQTAVWWSTVCQVQQQQHCKVILPCITCVLTDQFVCLQHLHFCVVILQCERKALELITLPNSMKDCWCFPAQGIWACSQVTFSWSTSFFFFFFRSLELPLCKILNFYIISRPELKSH